MFAPPVKPFIPAPEGKHVAILYYLVDLGTQQTKFGPKRQIEMRWELCDKLRNDGRPHVVTQKCTLNLNEGSTLRHTLETWLGRKFSADELNGVTPFDIKTVVGTAGILKVVQNEDGDKVWANIASLSPLTNGTTAPQRVNGKVYISLTPGEMSRDALDAAIEKLSDKMIAKIQASQEYNRLINPPVELLPQPAKKTIHEELNDAVPF